MADHKSVLELVLRTNTSDFSNGLKNANKSLGDFLRSVAGISAAFGITLGFKNITKSIIDMTKEFDASMRQVWTLTNQSREEFEKFSQTLLNMSANSIYSAKQLADAAYQAISAGVDVSEATRFLEISMEAAKAGAADLFTAVDGLTSTMNAWGLSVEDMTEVNDKFFTAVKLGKTTFQELTEQIGDVAPIASALGVSIDEVLGAITALTKQGLSTAMAVTDIRSALVAVTRQNPQSIRAAKEIGVAFSQQALQAQGLYKWLQTLRDAAEKYAQKTGQSVLSVMNDLFGRVEALNGVLGLTGSKAKIFGDIMEEMADSAGVAAEAADKVNDSLENVLKRLQNQINAFKIAIGTAFTPVIDSITNTIKAFTSQSQNINKMSIIISSLSMAMAVAVPVIYAFKKSLQALKITISPMLLALEGAFLAVSALATAFGFLEAKAKAADEAQKNVSSTVDNLSKLVSKDIGSSTKEENKTNSLAIAYQQLVELANEYNTATETGIGNIKNIKDKINELISAYPELSSAISIQNGKYVIQDNIIKSILIKQKQQLLVEQEKLKNRKAEVVLQQRQSEYELTILKQEKEKLEKERAAKAKEASESSKDARGKWTAVAQATKDYDRKITELTNKITRLQTEIDNKLLVSISDLNSAIDSNKQTITNLDKIINQNIDTENKLKQRIDDIKESIAGLKKEYDKLSKAYQENPTDENLYKELTDKANTYNELIETLKSSIEQNIDFYTTRLNDLTDATDISETVAAIEKLKGQLSELETISITKIAKPIDVDELEKAITDFQKDIDDTIKLAETAQNDSQKQFAKELLTKLQNNILEQISNITTMYLNTNDETLKETLKQINDDLNAQNSIIQDQLDKFASTQTTSTFSDTLIDFKTTLADYNQYLSAEMQNTFNILDNLLSSIEGRASDATGKIVGEIGQAFTDLLQQLATLSIQTQNLLAIEGNSPEVVKMLEEQIDKVKELKEKLLAIPVENLNATEKELRDMLLNSLETVLTQLNSKEIKIKLGIQLDTDVLKNEMHNVMNNILSTTDKDIQQQLFNEFSSKLIDKYITAIENNLPEAKNAIEDMREAFESFGKSHGIIEENTELVENLSAKYDELRNKLNRTVDRTSLKDINQYNEDLDKTINILEKYIEQQQNLGKNTSDLEAELQILKNQQEVYDKLSKDVKEYNDLLQTLAINNVKFSHASLSEQKTITNKMINDIKDFMAQVEAGVIKLPDVLIGLLAEQETQLTNRLSNINKELTQQELNDIKDRIKKEIDFIKKAYKIDNIKDVTDPEILQKIADVYANAYNEAFDKAKQQFMEGNTEAFQLFLKVANDFNNKMKNLPTPKSSTNDDRLKILKQQEQDLKTFINRAKEINDNSLVLEYYKQLGNVYEEMKKIAIEDNKLTDATKWGNLSNQVDIIIKKYEDMLNNVDKANELLEEQLGIFKELNYIDGQIAVIQQQISEKQQDLQEATDKNEIQNIITEIQNLQFELEKLNLLSKDYEIQIKKAFAYKNMGEAGQALSLFQQIEDSIKDILVSAEAMGMDMNLFKPLRDQLVQVNKEIKNLNIQNAYKQLNSTIDEFNNKLKETTNLEEKLKIEQEELDELTKLYNQYLAMSEEDKKYAEIVKYIQSIISSKTIEKKIDEEQLELIKAKVEEENKRAEQQIEITNKVLNIAKQYTSQLGLGGQVIDTVFDQIKIDTKEVEKNIDGQIVKVQQMNIELASTEMIWQNLGITIAKIVFSLIFDLVKMNKEFDKMNKKIGTLQSQMAKIDRTNVATKLDTVRNFNAKKKELEQLQKQLEGYKAAQAALTAAGTAIGAGIGSLFSPLGTLIGAGLGGWLGGQSFKDDIEELKNEIAELGDELLEAWQKAKDALGLSVDDIAGMLDNAFNADTYSGFIENFEGSLEQATKSALIKAFMSQEAIQILMDELSDVIAAAVLDGELSNEEKKTIRNKINDLEKVLEPFFDYINDEFSEGINTSANTATVRETISEQTGSKLVSLFSSSVLYLESINTNIVNMLKVLKEETIKVSMTGNEGIPADEYANI